MVLKKYFWVIYMIVMMPASLWAAEISEFHVSQVWVQLPNVTAYFHVQSVDGQPISNFQDIRLSATLGDKPLTVKEIRGFDPAQEGVAYIFLVDVSKSLTTVEFEGIKRAMSIWVDSMSPKDRTAVMVFGTTVRLLNDFTGDKGSIKNIINSLTPTDDNTQLHQGLVKAMELGKRKDQALPIRRAIITLSDGQDDFAGGMTKAEVLNQMDVDPIPVYAIGFARLPITREKETNLKILGEFARTSGGMYFKSGDIPLADIYAAVHASVCNVGAVKLTCDDCKADGGVYRFQANLLSGSRSVSGGLNIRLLPPIEAPVSMPKVLQNTEGHSPKSPPKSFYWKHRYDAAGAGIAVLLFLLIMLHRKKKAAPEMNVSAPEAELGQDFNMLKRDDKTSDIKSYERPKPKKVKMVTVGAGHGEQSHEVEITNSVFIGRDKSTCGFCIPDDDEISSQHCELVLKDNNFYIRDMGSTNGTLVNGVPFSGLYKLQSSDLILVGRTELRILF